MGEMLAQVWLKSIKKMSELFDKEVNAQKESLKNTSGVPTSPRKVCNEK